METNDARELIRALKRIADSVERPEVHFAGERPKPAAPADLKGTVSAVRFHPDPHQEPGEFPSSTTTRERFWSDMPLSQRRTASFPLASGDL